MGQQGVRALFVTMDRRLAASASMAVRRRRRGLVAALTAVVAALGMGPLASSASAASESCTAPTTVVVDGYVGSTYMRLVAQPNPTNQNVTWVCFRVYGGSSSLDKGGRIDVTGAQVAPQAPTVDSNAQACSTTTGNTVPPPHPLVAGQVGDPTGPAYVPFLLDTYSASGAAWVCLQAGGVSQRLVVSTGGVSAPGVASTLDSAGTPLPPPAPGPTGYPSTTCQAGTPPATLLVDARFGNTSVWAFEWQPSSTRVALCLRVTGGGAPTIGGTLDTNGSPGVTPVFLTSSDTTPCTFTIASLTQPIQASVKTSPTNANPASMCLSAAGTSERVTAGFTGSPTTPSWTKDPDSTG